jgi:hypothetical protein
LIFNDLYVDRIVWNKVRTVKNPDAGKRISRPNALTNGRPSILRIFALSMIKQGNKRGV